MKNQYQLPENILELSYIDTLSSRISLLEESILSTPPTCPEDLEGWELLTEAKQIRTSLIQDNLALLN